VVDLVEAYFDESGTHGGSEFMCVGGYIAEAEKSKTMQDEWQIMLADYDLPYFHMVDCAHGSAPFDKLTLDERIAVETRAIGLMRANIAECFVLSILPAEHARWIPTSPLFGSPYSVCIHNCLTIVQAWADKNHFHGDVAYFFESGHKSQSEANGIMNKIFSVPSLRKEQRYLSHTFADKKKVFGLQAADIIAWQWYTECKRRIERVRPNKRKDLSALMEPRADGTKFFAGAHLGAQFLQQIATPHLRHEYPLTYPWSNPK
jgi:hypothetical protein